MEQITKLEERDEANQKQAEKEIKRIEREVRKGKKVIKIENDDVLRYFKKEIEDMLYYNDYMLIKIEWIDEVLIHEPEYEEPYEEYITHNNYYLIKALNIKKIKLK